MAAVDRSQDRVIERRLIAEQHAEPGERRGLGDRIDRLVGAGRAIDERRPDAALGVAELIAR